MKIITHRGIDDEHNHQFTESSREAFSFFLNAGFGLEFDIKITKDFVPVISHDDCLTRLAGIPMPHIAEMTAEEFLNTPLPNGHTLTLAELISLMKEALPVTTRIHAFHLKHDNQSLESITTLLPFLEELSNLPHIVFDVKPEVAFEIKKHIPGLSLAASVAHPFDVQRYNEAVGGTLLTIEDIVLHANVYDWAWLDEWDLMDTHNKKKLLYTEETFSSLRAINTKIAVVSPELHATSPKLAGAESHEDANNEKALEGRWREILALSPDTICTDHPFKLRHLLS
jgi:Glycerophosphoryl diester phosphodiesterase family